jgi:hypothetical protein
MRDDEKDLLLRQTRQVSFRDVVHALTHQDTIIDIQHHNQTNYSHQKKLIILLNGYPHEVPYVQQ